MNAMEEFDRKLRLFLGADGAEEPAEARQRSRQAARAARGEERDLRRRLYAEQADVDRLNRRSLAALFYAVTGQKAGKLAAEARGAGGRGAARCGCARAREPRCGPAPHGRGAVRSFPAASASMRRRSSRKAGDPMAGGADAERIDRLENELSACANVKREAEEAIEATAAQSLAESVLGALDSAEGWGTWDLVGGGS